MCILERPRSHVSDLMLTATIYARWSQLFDKDTDWNVISEKMPGVNNRQVKLSRGKFLGGCSGCNGTLCIRGSKQDYDDWGIEGWNGDEFFKYMCKVRAPKFQPSAALPASSQNMSNLSHRDLAISLVLARDRT